MRRSPKGLHQLLQAASLPGPFVLVGASFGGLNARVYNALYPDEVGGMVLVDSAHEDEPRRAPKFFLASSRPRYLWYPLHLLFQGAFRTGLVRLTRSSEGKGGLVPALARQPKSVVSSALTGMVEPESYDQARSAGGLGDKPLIVLTAGKPLSFDDPEMSRQAAEYQQVWIHEMQAQLARLSTRGRQVIVANSDHAIAPEALIAATREVVADIRK